MCVCVSVCVCVCVCVYVCVCVHVCVCVCVDISDCVNLCKNINVLIRPISTSICTIPFFSLYITLIHLLIYFQLPYTLCFTHIPSPHLYVLYLSFLYILHLSIYWSTENFLIIHSDTVSTFIFTMPFFFIYITRIHLLIHFEFPYTSLVYHVQFSWYYAFLFFVYYTYQSIDGLYISVYFTHIPCPPLYVLCLSLLDVLHSSIQGFTSHFLILYSCTMPFFSLHISRIRLLIDWKFTYYAFSPLL